MSASEPRSGIIAASISASGTLLGILRRIGPRRPQLLMLTGLLLLILTVTGVFAYQAADAAGKQRAIAEQALDDYAAMAANRWREMSEYLAFETLRKMLAPAERLLRAGADPDVVLASIEFNYFCDCAEADWIAARFQFGPAEDDRAGIDGEPGRAALAAAIERSAGAYFRTGARIGTVTVRDTVAFYLAMEDEQGVVTHAVGLLGGPQLLGALVRHAAEQETVLVVAHGLDAVQDDVVHLRATFTGRDVYESAARYEQRYAAAAVTAEPIAGVTLHVAVNPAAAGLLLIGGMPESRMPLLAALLVLTVLLLGAAVVLIRRDAELNRLRAEFVAGVSHELRTPVAQIRMFAETLRLGRVRTETERRRSVEIIDQEAKRLMHLIENVLLFARAERRSARINASPRPLGPELHQAIESFAPLCRARDVQIRAELEAGVIAPVDPNALRQILVNLLDNAVKFGPVGQRITVGMALFGSAVRVWVDDEGPGVPHGSWKRVFEPFQRGDRDVDRAVGGSGIGLAVVRELAELHGGRAWIEDAPGGGARVGVAIPDAFVDLAAGAVA